MSGPVERTEYRVVAMHGDQECTPVDLTPYLSEAERYRDREKEHSARIQTRTVTETPWVDLAGEGEDRGED